MWRRKKTGPTAVSAAGPGNDIDQARALRERATRDLEALHAQAPYVNRLVSVLVERRKTNHFGDELTVTWVPRRAD